MYLTTNLFSTLLTNLQQKEAKLFCNQSYNVHHALQNKKRRSISKNLLSKITTKFLQPIYVPTYIPECSLNVN
jgi:hypothetical protein